MPIARDNQVHWAHGSIGVNGLASLGVFLERVQQENLVGVLLNAPRLSKVLHGRGLVGLVFTGAVELVGSDDGTTKFTRQYFESS